MDSESLQIHDETTLAITENTSKNTEASAQNPTGKGELLPEIGAGILGEIVAVAISYALVFLGNLGTDHPAESWNELVSYLVFAPALSVILAIPCMAGFIRFAGMRTGGHDKRSRCCLGIFLGILFTAFFITISILMGSARGIKISLEACPVLLLVGAVIGYRKDAESH